jgi:hypothetical protein
LPFCVAEPKTRNQGHSQRRGLVSHVPCLKNVKDLPVPAAAGAFEISWRDAAGGGGAESSVQAVNKYERVRRSGADLVTCAS